MKITKKEIIDVSSTFEKFRDSLDGFNYVVWLNAVTFTYDENCKFSLINLDEILKKTDIINKERHDSNSSSDKITESSLQAMIADIRDCLSYISADDCSVRMTNNQQLINSRNASFWDLVSKHFSQTPTKVIRYETSGSTYFNYFVMWGFCYILINEKNKTGILLVGGASD